MKKIIFMLTLVAVAFSANFATAQYGQKDIVDVAVSVDDFSTLVTALKSAELVEALKGDGPFTVFAPVNSGFAKIDESTLNSLLTPANQDKLTAILTYHVVPGKVMAADVADALEKGNGSASLTTLNGAKLMAELKDGAIYLKDQNGNYSRITKTDVKASNGVIHIIEDVVMP